MKKNHRIIPALIALLVIVSMLAGCAAKTPAAPSAKPSEPAAAANTPVYGGTLVVSQSTQQNEDNYFPPTSANSAMLQNSRPCLEPLFEIASDGKLIPFLVKEYKVEENGKKYILTLQQGVKFHDGTDFNAEAVKWNIEQTKQAKIHTVFNTVESVTVNDANTLTLNMTAPDLFFLNTLATSQGGLMVSPTAVKAKDAEWAKTHPVGTGPFTLKTWDYNVQMVYEKNANYWRKDASGNKLPYLDGITFKFIPENVTSTAAFKNKELDMVRDLTSEMITNLKDTCKVTIYDYPSIAVNIWFPTLVSDSKFQNVKVRQAICHAIDVPTIIKSIYGSEWSATNQLSYTGSPLFNKDIAGYKYDPQKAKDLLKEAGFPDGFETSIVLENNPQNTVLAQTLQAYLKAVNIKLTIDLADSARYAQSVMFSSWGDQLAAISYTYSPDEICAIRRMLNPESTLLKSTVAFPDEYKSLMKKLLSATTIEDANKTFLEADKFLIDDACLLLPLCLNHYAVAQQNYVHGTGAGVDGETQIRYWSPETIWMEKH